MDNATAPVPALHRGPRMGDVFPFRRPAAHTSKRVSPCGDYWYFPGESASIIAGSSWSAEGQDAVGGNGE